MVFNKLRWSNFIIFPSLCVMMNFKILSNVLCNYFPVQLRLIGAQELNLCRFLLISTNLPKITTYVISHF